MGELIIRPKDINEDFIRDISRIVDIDKEVCHYTETCGYFFREKGKLAFNIGGNTLHNIGMYLDGIFKGVDYRKETKEELEQLIDTFESRASKRPPERKLDIELDRTEWAYREYGSLYDHFAKLHRIASRGDFETPYFQESAMNAINKVRQCSHQKLISGKKRFHCHSNGNPPTFGDFPVLPIFGPKIVISHNYDNDVTDLSFMVYLINSQRDSKVIYENTSEQEENKSNKSVDPNFEIAA